MTLLEYVASLQDQGLSQDEILSKTKDWKNKNKEEDEVLISETVELDKVDLGTVKKKDGVPGAVAPSMGPQEAPQPATEFGLEDTFSVSPQVDQDVTSDTVEEKKDGDWDFWQETGTKIKAATVDALGKLSRVPTFLNEIQAAISREFMTDEEKARYDALDPLTKQVLANISPQPGLTDLANTGLQNYEESVKKAEKIREDLTQFETTIGEEYAKGNFVEATVRTASDALGSLPSVVQSMIPYVGIASIFAGEAAGASAEAQKEGEELSLKTIGYSTVKGASEALLEVTTKKIGGQMFKNLSGKGANEVKKSLTQVMLGIGKDYGAEGLSESATETINRMADAVILGKKDAFDNYFKEVIDVFLVGGAMGGGMSTTGVGGKIIRNTLEDNSVKNDLNKTEYKNLTDAYESPDLTEGLSELTENRFTQKKLDAELNEKVGQGVFTVEKSNEIKNNFREIQGALNTIKPLGISTKNKAPIVNLVVEQKKLKQEIKSIDNPSLTKEQSERLSEIDKQLGDLITKDKSEKIDIGAKKIAEEIGVGFESFETQEDVDSAIETLKEEGSEIDTKNSDNYGTFVVLPDGRRIIVLNKEVATEDRTFTEGQHETGHAVLYETVKNKPEAAVALGKSLLNELQTNENITIKPEFKARLDQYVEDANISEADTMEEVLTLASEALTEGTIEINETIGDKIGGFIRRALSAMGMKVKFKNGKDVLNFIKDYNRSVHRQQGLSRGLKKAAVEGVEVDIAPQEITDLKQSIAKESKRVEDSQEVQRLYDDQGVSAAMDIINKFKPITNRIVESRSQAPNFDRQLLTDEIETGPRGILDLIMEYKPESGVPLAAYINKFLPSRAIEASRRVLGEEFTTDVTEAKGVVAEEVDETVTKEKPIAKKPTETVEFSQAQVEKVGAKDKAEVETRITEATKEAFKGQDIKTFGQTRNVPKTVADIYAGMFGLNPQTITDKTRNYQKTDSEGLTTAKQFLLKNANNDFARLPETKDGFGKGTFLPRNVMNALYTNGKLTGTLKDYMDLIRQKPVKPIYRDAVGQTIRGLLNLHIRNRMFESLVSTTAERAVGGAKFSKRKAVEDINMFIENQAFEKVSDELAAENKRWSYIAKKADVDFISSKNSEDVKKMQDWVVNVLAPRVPKSFFTNGTFANAGMSAAKRNFFFTSGLLKQDGTLGELGILLQDAVFAKENDNISKAVFRDTYVTGGRQGKVSERFINKFNSEQFKKEQQAKLQGLKDLFKVFETLMKENKNNTSFIIALLSSTSQGMNHFVRTSAPIKFYSKDVSSGIVEEHTMPASLVAKYLFNSAFAGTINKDFKNIEKNYFQGALALADDKKLKGKKPNGEPFNYIAMTPEGWKVTDNIWARYFNINVANTRGGIDPSNIVLSTGKTVFETFSITPSGLKLNEQGVKDVPKVENALNTVLPKSMESKKKISAQQNIYNQSILDEALNKARRPDAPVKKIRVFDFDDTLARSKSQVLYTVPNVEGGFSEGATNLKAIFMVGGPGAGKTNVGKGLQLGRRGYKVVNQDIALEAMKAESKLPAKESDYTAEQRSLRSKLGAAARKAAVAKFDKYAAAGNGMVIDGTGASYNATTKKIKALQDAGYEVHMVVATTPLETAIERNKARAERSLPDFVVKKTYESVQESLKKYREDFGDRLYEINTETIEYGKPLPNDFLQKVYAGINANKVGKVDASDFATEYNVLESQGAKFDFREFSKVIEGEKGPLFSVAQKIAKVRGTEDIFILTARPADAAKPIQEFMKVNGIDIPLKNITGLGDGTAEAKGRWIADKAAEGYNDFYFADDAVKNVQAVKDVLSQVDVKSKVQQAKASKRKTFDKVFNDIIEQKTGIESYKDYSAAKAKTVGANKGKFTFFTTPSAEDFLGLLYKTLGKGKVGDAQMAFYKENLLDPFNRAEMAISQAKVAAGRDYKALKKQFKGVPKTLEKETGISKYSYQHAIRTYIWDAQGIEVPGLSKRDQKRLTDFIKADPELQAFADQLVNIQKGKPYPKPDKDWTAGNITTDVISGINKVNRAEYLQEWQENVDIIFSEKNMNKLEAAFGVKYVEALKDSLRAMKSGSNRPLGGDRVSNQILDWLNNSVGAIMFLNTRSAVLQTISAVNFINWGDNNILKAGKAFANQKQFWGDFLTLMNSDYLLERRDGLKINVSESEIADAVEGSKNKVNAAISYLLNKGFVFTRYADSFAIASGGATFYRNRIESLVEQGMDRKLAEQQAFEDFRLIAEENQQSSSPMRISQQQRSLIGRIILQFGNTQLQYVRIQKRAVQDLVNKRGDWRANISKIVYYGAIQNIMFNALQSGLAWALFDDDEDDEELTEANKEQKLERALNGAIDSQLKGLGIQGAVIAGVKNSLMTIAEQADKKSPKFEEALDDLLSIAPALGSKIRKLKSAARTVSWNGKEIKEKGFSMDNPAYLAGAQTISAIFNIPLDRAVMKMNNMRNILNPATENWQKVALALGWSGWDVGLPYFGLAEAEPVLTETQKQVKKLFNLNKSDQVKMLLDLGLTKKEIRALTKEDDRVKEIIKLQNKNKDGK
jgi:biotin operon repressor/histone H3/H4